MAAMLKTLLHVCFITALTCTLYQHVHNKPKNELIELTNSILDDATYVLSTKKNGVRIKDISTTLTDTSNAKPDSASHGLKYTTKPSHGNATTTLSASDKKNFISRFTANTKRNRGNTNRVNSDYSKKSFFESRTVVFNKLFTTTKSPTKRKPRGHMTTTDTDNIINLSEKRLNENRELPSITNETVRPLELSKRSTIPNVPTTKRAKVQKSTVGLKMKEHLQTPKSKGMKINEFFHFATNIITKPNKLVAEKQKQYSLKTNTKSGYETRQTHLRSNSLQTKTTHSSTKRYQNISNLNVLPATKNKQIINHEIHGKVAHENNLKLTEKSTIKPQSKIVKSEIISRVNNSQRPIFVHNSDRRDNSLNPTKIRNTYSIPTKKRRGYNVNPTQAKITKSILNSTTKKRSISEDSHKYLKITNSDFHSRIEKHANKPTKMIKRNTISQLTKVERNTISQLTKVKENIASESDIEKRQDIPKSKDEGTLIIIDYDKENIEDNEGKRSEIERDSGLIDRHGYTIILNNNGNDDNEAKKEDIYQELKEHFTEMEHHFQNLVDQDNKKMVKVLVITPKSEQTGNQRDNLPDEPDDLMSELKPQFVSLNELTDVSKSSELDADIDKLKHVKEKLMLLNEDDNLSKENKSHVNNERETSGKKPLSDADKETVSRKSLSDAERQIEILETMSNDIKDSKETRVFIKLPSNSSTSAAEKISRNETSVPKINPQVHMHFHDAKIINHDEVKETEENGEYKKIKSIQADDDNLMSANKLTDKDMLLNNDSKEINPTNERVNTGTSRNTKQITVTNNTINQLVGSNVHSHLKLRLIDNGSSHDNLGESEHRKQHFIHVNESLDEAIETHNIYNEKDVEINKNILVNVNKMLRSEETPRDNQSTNRKHEIFPSKNNESKDLPNSGLEKSPNLLLKQSSEEESVTKKVLTPPGNPSPDAHKAITELEPEIISPTRVMNPHRLQENTETTMKQTTTHTTKPVTESTTKPVTESTTKSATESTTKPATDSTTKAATKQSAEPTKHITGAGKTTEHLKHTTAQSDRQATKKNMKPTTTKQMPDTKRSTDRITLRKPIPKVLEKRKAEAIVEFLNKDPLETWRYHFRSLKSLDLNSSILRSGLVNAGNIDRLKGVMKRALEGKDITLTIVGGSISAGGGLYKDRGNIDGLYYKGVVDWWNKMITPLTGSDMLVNNIAVGSIGTDYFSYCVKNHISTEADIVLWELSANDFNRYKMQPTKGARPLERLTRMILELPYKPALLYINFFKGVDYKATRESCPNFEDQGEDIIAHYYKIPSLSWRAMVCDGLVHNEPGYGIESLFSLDQYHPSLRGHAQMSLLLLLHLRHVMRAVLQYAIDHNGYIINFEGRYNLPEPLFMGPKYPEPLCWSLITADLSEKITNSLQVKVVKQLGFKLEYATNFPIRLDKVICWRAERPDAQLAVQFFIPELYGTDGQKRLRSEVIITSHTRWGGSAKMWIDDNTDREIVVKEGRPNDPGKRTQVDSIASDIGPGTHTLNVFSREGAFCLAAIMIDGS